jgi:hypothetical protein
MHQRTERANDRALIGHGAVQDGDQLRVRGAPTERGQVGVQLGQRTRHLGAGRERSEVAGVLGGLLLGVVCGATMWTNVPGDVLVASPSTSVGVIPAAISASWSLFMRTAWV